MKTIELKDLFTTDELLHAYRLFRDKPDISKAEHIDEEVVTPALERINRVTGQDNHSRYWAYVLINAFTHSDDLVNA